MPNEPPASAVRTVDSSTNTPIVYRLEDWLSLHPPMPITPTTAGDFGVDYDAALAVKGKLYQDGDTIDITFTGIATAGEGILWVEMISYGEAIAAEDVS